MRSSTLTLLAVGLAASGCGALNQPVPAPLPDRFEPGATYTISIRNQSVCPLTVFLDSERISSVGPYESATVAFVAQADSRLSTNIPYGYDAVGVPCGSTSPLPIRLGVVSIERPDSAPARLRS